MMLRICDKRTGRQFACFTLPKNITFAQLDRIRNNVIKRFGNTVSVRLAL